MYIAITTFILSFTACSVGVKYGDLELKFRST